MTVVCDCRPFVFEKQFVCLCFSISNGAFNIGCDANLYQNGANKFPASCFIIIPIVHNTGPINIAGCNLLCCLCLFLVPSRLWFSFGKTKRFLMLRALSWKSFFNSFPFTPSALKIYQIFQWPTQWSVESICSRFWHFTANLLLGHVHRIYHFVNGKCYLGSNIYGVAIWGEPERKFIYRDWWR